MLRVSKLTDYGTVVMTYLAQDAARVRNAAQIAAGTGVAPPTVAKVLKALAREQLVVSHRGAKGGYVLARAPEQISMAQIIAAMEGPIALTECSNMVGACVHEPVCSIRINWQRINGAVRAALEVVTLAELAEPPHVYPDATALPIRRRARADRAASDLRGSAEE
jgi:FeS assembly SUF system regulator